MVKYLNYFQYNSKVILTYFFMLIILSSLVNLQASKIPLTLILIFIFYIVDEIRAGLFKKDNISHLSHIIGALCGGIYGFYFL